MCETGHCDLDGYRLVVCTAVISPPVISNSSRRFCDQHEMSLQTATGRSFSLGHDADTVADEYIRHYYGEAFFPMARADTLTSPHQISDELDRLTNAGVTDLVLNFQRDTLERSLASMARFCDEIRPLIRS